MATALEFLKELLSGVGGIMATALEFLKEQLSGVGGLMATTLGLKGLKERLRDHHPQKEELLQGLKETITEFDREKLSNLHQVLLNRTKELGEALQGPKETTSQFLQEKLPWLIVLWKAAVDFLVQKLEALLPPGASSDTVRIWVQLAMPLLLFLSLPILHYFLYFLCRCFLLAWNTMIACVKASYWAIVMIVKTFARAPWWTIKAFARAPWWTIKAFATAAWWTIKAFARAPWWTIKAFARAVWETIKGDGGKMMRAPGRPGHRIPRAGFEADPGSYFRELHANAPRQGASSKSKWFTVGAGVVTAGVVLLKLL